ncbi:hypothetical protein [Rhodoblastus sp.]|uniref:hypothetical protein n=1 Tax=Rhodoblastus sp. TaxID=1962975 RepID=UPI003F945EC9
MPRVLEEVTETEITPQHVEQRVADWHDRIVGLYTQIESWLPDGYSARHDRTMLMHEEMMQKFGVAARKLPILEITRDSVPVAKIEPRGLWIIGANGRLDMIVGQNQYIIVDTAENFASPSWIFTPLSNRQNRHPVTQQTFCSLLKV